mmetsp:Transcript_21291/g.48942  ORF Transcript_21291/g.48942 Transcript_21291/m.48942 type:complete len:305 (-) Transcript_21291:241-1155(-)
MRVFERRFLADESFVQTALMHSTFRLTNINANMRYIWWPHYEGDPASYWQRMGHSFVGGPQVINESVAPDVFKSPYMFARKFDPGVDPNAVRLWDDWMGRKLKGEADPEQAPLGGRPPRPPVAAEGGAADGDTGGSDDLVPVLSPRRPRLVRSIVFADGSSCDCGLLCHHNDNCCTDWLDLCPDHAAKEASSRPCPEPAVPPLASSLPIGRPLTLTFVNHARYPVRLYYERPTRGEGVEVGVVEGGGGTLTFESAETHAWVARSFSGVTVMELPPFSKQPPRATAEIYECDLSTAGRKLHFGWQ